MPVTGSFLGRERNASVVIAQEHRGEIRVGLGEPTQWVTTRVFHRVRCLLSEPVPRNCPERLSIFQILPLDERLCPPPVGIPLQAFERSARFAFLVRPIHPLRPADRPPELCREAVNCILPFFLMLVCHCGDAFAPANARQIFVSMEFRRAMISNVQEIRRDTRQRCHLLVCVSIFTSWPGGQRASLSSSRGQ